MLSFKVRYNINKKFTRLSGVKRALKINALEISSLAKATVNVDTTRLQSDIAFYVENNGMTILIGSRVEYAAPQEAIKSYLESSLESQEPILKQDIDNAILKGV